MSQGLVTVAAACDPSTPQADQSCNPGPSGPGGGPGGGESGGCEDNCDRYDFAGTATEHTVCVALLSTTYLGLYSPVTAPPKKKNSRSLDIFLDSVESGDSLCAPTV